MLFSEIYSAYYNAVARLINKAIDGKLDNKSANKIIKDTAFLDSSIFILQAIKSEQWQIITKEFKTPIKNKTSMPTTLLQKRFLKAITIDKRFRLFADEIDGLEDIEPLYYPNDFYYFDVIKDGDAFNDENYSRIFKTILMAVREQKRLKIVFESGKGYFLENIYNPQKIEYSEKDDKFRLICSGRYEPTTINIARIKSCEILNQGYENSVGSFKRKKNTVILYICNERNALERSMLHFANFEKITEQIDEKNYKMELSYNKDDETEVLIRVLSFGPMVKVIHPIKFKNLIKERLENQKKLRTV